MTISGPSKKKIAQNCNFYTFQQNSSLITLILHTLLKNVKYLSYKTATESINLTVHSEYTTDRIIQSDNYKR